MSYLGTGGSGPVTLRRIPPGDAGVRQTLEHMRRLARRDSRDPSVVDTARTVAGGARGLRGAALLRSWLAAHVRYADDPPGVELVQAPRVQLARIRATGRTAGDCDDVAVLAAALGMALGYRARYVVVSFGPWPYEHVWTELRAPGAGWLELDTTRPAGVPAGAWIHRQAEFAL